MTMRLLHRFGEITRTRYFWIVVGTLIVSTVFYYSTPQTQALPSTGLPLTRHTIERILFILPVALATFAYGRAGGLIILLIATTIMLVQVFLFSAYPLDAFAATMGIAVVSYTFVWIIGTQEKEKMLRERVLEELKVLNAVSVALTQSLDLDEILHDALVKILDIAKDEDAKGGVFLLDPQTQQLHLRVHHRLTPDAVQDMALTVMEECLSEHLAKSGEQVSDDGCVKFARDTRCDDVLPRSRIIVGLTAREKTMGGMLLCFSKFYKLRVEDKQLFASIGRHMGVAVENVSLYENLRYYVRQITLAQEEERKRIARELHDDTSQGLIDLSRRVDNLAITSKNLSEVDLEKLEELQNLIETLLRSTHRFCRDLRPPVLDDLGLLPALESALDDLQKAGIHTELKVCGNRRRLASEVELALFRIMQESLNNVRRHSGASRVEITVDFGETDLRLIVADNGHGFDLSQSAEGMALTGKLGLMGMRERAQLLGGKLTIESVQEKGTTIITDVPAETLAG